MPLVRLPKIGLSLFGKLGEVRPGEDQVLAYWLSQLLLRLHQVHLQLQCVTDSQLLKSGIIPRVFMVIFYLILEQIHQVDPDQRRPSRPNGLFLRLYRPFLEIHFYESFI